VVTARAVIDATHMPLVSEGKFFAKAYPYAHALVAARIDPARAPDGMFISAEQPTRSVRTARWGDEAWLVAAGGSFKPGDSEEAEATLKDLVEFVRAEFGIVAIDYQWVNEDYESMDGMPLVGRASSSAEHLYVATGFNAWGITNGTAAGMILCDLISGGVRRYPHQAAGGREELHQREHRDRGRADRWLPEGGAALARRATRRRGRHCQAERGAHRRVPRPARRTPCGLRGVHSHGLRAGLELGRPNLGLLVPRLPLRARRQRDPRPRDDRLATVAGRLNQPHPQASKAKVEMALSSIRG
jgi:hypothetical protein